LGRRLYKHHYMMRPEVDCLRWLGAVASFEERSYRHVPFLYEIAVAACTATRLVSNHWSTEKLLQEGALNRYKDLPIIEDRKHRRIERSERVWDHLYRVYGVTREELRELQDELIQWARGGMRLPYRLTSPAVYGFVTHDDK
jgi:hypothetical protein